MAGFFEEIAKRKAQRDKARKGSSEKIKRRRKKGRFNPKKAEGRRKIVIKLFPKDD